MEIIIKPTAACNFNCKFCSAAYCNIRHPSDNRVPEVIKDFIQKGEPRDVIITGGEPLMISPQYYYELHDICKCHVGITSNLKNFYLHPEEWEALFKEPWFTVATSFNYGDTRMWDENTVFTEEMFIKVMELYRERINEHIPTFLAVIDYSNENTVMDHIELAKRLGTTAKINGAFKVGRQSTIYPRYKMYQHYIRIIEAGLEQYEENCLERRIDKCPKCLGRACQSQIRCIGESTDGKLLVSICDEQFSMGHYLPEDKWFIPYGTCRLPQEEFIKPECAYCELFWLCNSCDNARRESKCVPEHCDEMKKLLPKLKEHEFVMEVNR